MKPTKSNSNTGVKNIGSYNAGGHNRGDRNTGCENVGSYNTGDRNVGTYNSGAGNKGNGNVGNGNTGDGNVGDWNTTSFSAGCFNTVEQKIMLFNRPADITMREWLNSDAFMILLDIPTSQTKWIEENEMCVEETELQPEIKEMGGYLEIADWRSERQKWFDELEERDKETIKGIPNFDAEIFEKCTGIKV